MRSNKTHQYVSYISESIICLTKLSISHDFCSEYEKPIKWMSYFLFTFLTKKREILFLVWSAVCIFSYIAGSKPRILCSRNFVRARRHRKTPQC